MISSSELDTFQAVVYRKTDSVACQDDLFGPTQSTQPGLSFGANRPISVLYAQLSPRPKHCGQTLLDGKLFFFLFLSGAEESASCVVFQRPCPAGIGDRVLLYQMLIFVITFPLALGLSRGCPPTWRTPLCILYVCSRSHITPSPGRVSSQRILSNGAVPTLLILFYFFFHPLAERIRASSLSGELF